MRKQNLELRRVRQIWVGFLNEATIRSRTLITNLIYSPIFRLVNTDNNLSRLLEYFGL